MLTTNAKEALELTIAEFNDWAIKVPDYSKFKLNDIKGVFTEKLKRNLASCSMDSKLLDKQCFNAELIKVMLVENAVLVDLYFADCNRPTGTWRTRQEQLGEFLNPILECIHIPTVGRRGEPLNVIRPIENIIQSITNFKIK